MATFSDLMNLLLCFFVLLFSMSTVSEEKLEMLIQSFQSAFSVLPAGGSTISVEGNLISSGVSALEQFDAFFNASTSNNGEDDNKGAQADTESDKTGQSGQASGQNDGSQTDSQGRENAGEATEQGDESEQGKATTEGEETNQGKDTQEGQAQNEDQNAGSAEELSESELIAEYEKAGIAESEKIAERIEKDAKKFGIQDQIEVTFNGQYILLTLNGALLFDNAKAEVKEQALPLIDKLGAILESYGDNLIQIEGHTDNIPMHSSKYENNDVLSMYRAYNVAEYIRGITTIDPSHIVSAGRGEYYPVADNSTAEGRALNRRVEIKIFNSYNSEEIQE